MFEYFFIIGTLFLILSGALDEFRINKYISCSMLIIIFLLSMLQDVNLEYTLYFSWAGAFIFISSILMYVIMSDEHFATLLYSTTLGLLVWAIVSLVPGLNSWYFKGIMFSLIGAMLAGTYFQGAVISVFACVICSVFTALLSIDFELIRLFIFIGDEKTAVIVSFLLPIMLMSLAGKKKKEIILESMHGAS